jgi:phage terminase large subunit GpA-like protein
LAGDPDLNEVWQRLEALRTRGWQHESGATLYIRSVFIDSSYKTERVYAYVRSREGQGVYAIQGQDKRAKDLFVRPKRRNRHGVRPITLATYSLKDTVFARLKKTNPGPNYVHFCAPKSPVDGMDANFFQQFGAEKLIREKDRKGRVRRVYKQVAERNEAIDLTCYAYAALLFLGPSVTEDMERWHDAVCEEGRKARETTPATPARPPETLFPSRPRPRSTWATAPLTGR